MLMNKVQVPSFGMYFPQKVSEFGQLAVHWVAPGLSFRKEGTKRDMVAIGTPTLLRCIAVRDELLPIPLLVCEFDK